MGANYINLNIDYYGCSFNPRTRDGCENNRSKRSVGHESFNPRTRDGCEWS